MIFKNNYFFLSTFYRSKIEFEINGKLCKFTNAEAAYQAMKNPEIADKFSQIKGLEAKRMEESLKITVPDWGHFKLFAMGKVLHEKFKNRMLFLQLKTIKEPIINDNYWGDTFWGVCKGEGKNILGKMLTVIRDTDNDLDKLYDYIKKELLKEV